MRPAYSILGWFLALTLASLGACSPLFLIPACEYDPRFEFCQQPGDDMGRYGGLADRPTDLSRPSMKPPVSFSLVAQSPLATMRKWVGIRSPNLILFTNQPAPTSDANIEVYNLLNTSQSWALVAVSCSICPKSIKNVKLATDYVLTSKSMFFVIKPDYAYSINTDGSLSSSTINSIDHKLTTNFRPFVSPDIDILAYQRMVNTSNSSEFVYFSNDVKQALSFAQRPIIPQTKYYIIGNLDVEGRNLSDNEILIFEENRLQGVFRTNKFLTSVVGDDELSIEINKSIVDAHATVPQTPIRTGFIVDLNHDGYMELVYAQHRQIFATTYNPYKEFGSRFENWPQPIITIDADHTATLSAADLDGDGYPELAIETRGSSDEPLAVLFYLNNSK